jgi:hypothetical protein
MFYYLRGLAGKRVQVTVEKFKNNRTIQQNRYYWGIVVKLIAEHTGHDPEQLHELLKQKFSPKWYFTPEKNLMMGGASIPTSTARLDTLEFVEYTEKCRMWANEFFNLNIPLPGDIKV